jgi:hypothetical protein
LFKCLNTSGQSHDIPVTCDCRDISFDAFADTIARKHGISFFYDTAWTRSVRIALDDQVQLDKVLETALKGRNIYFVRDLQGNYIFTRDFIILTGLSEKFSIPGEFADNDTLSIARRMATVGQQPTGQTKSANSELISIGNPANRTSKATISGFITEEQTGDPVIGAAILVQDIKQGTMSDATGYYLVELPTGKHTLNIHSLGMRDASFQVMVYSDGTFNIKMSEKITQLKDITIVADRGNNITSLQMGVEKLDIKSIKQLPTSLGEADIVKVALLLPGVQTVGEGASGFNVRGGGIDQNLFTLNGAPVFNTSHLFGFFSVFNPDVVKDFEIYKSGIPAQYGGRISSVFDVQSKSGNRKTFGVTGGISPVTLKLTVDGPVIKNKLSFLVGVRSTYSDWILRQINKAEIRNSRASFYDVNGKLSYEINKKNTLEVSGYTSYDFFKLNFDTTYEYHSECATLLWKHHFSTKLVTTLSALGSNYRYQVESQKDPLNAFKMGYKVRYRELKTDFAFYPVTVHKITFGIGNIWYNLQPGNLSPASPTSAVDNTRLETERAIESALYLADQYDVTSHLSVYAGLRAVVYNFLGPKTVYAYFTGGPVNESTRYDTSFYGKNKIIRTYVALEPRVSLRYTLSPSSSIKISYNRMNQYLNMMSNTTAVSPTDTWKLSDSHIQPQTGDQFAAGFYLDFRKNTIETSVEAYYKNLKRIIDYKGGARLLMNETIETDLLEGKGKAYGIELMIKKPMGKLNGWISYTYSRVFYKVDGTSQEEKINGGIYFPANHDRPHDFSLVQNFRFSRRFSISNNLVYSTGRPITYPVGKWSDDLLYYSKRNEYRIPDYFRWDFSANLDGNLKSKKLAHGSWSLSVYNVTGRFNVYSVYFKTEQGQVKGYMLSVFPKPVITLSYNFRF